MISKYVMQISYFIAILLHIKNGIWIGYYIPIVLPFAVWSGIICQYIDHYWTSFWSQSGLDESSGRKSATFLYGIAFLVYLMFSKVRIIIEYKWKQWFLTKMTLLQKGMWILNNKKAPAASLKRCKWGVGCPIHQIMLLILISIRY